MFVYKQLHPAAAIICAVATLTIAPDAAPIPIPSPMTPTKIAPADNMPESAGNTPESAAAMPIPAVVMPESTAISSATIPIPPEPHRIPPESHLIPPEPEPIPSESTVKLGSWHEIVIAKPTIMTASPAITISHPAFRIITISTHTARVSAFAAWVEKVMKVMAVAPLSAYVYPLS